MKKTIAAILALALLTLALSASALAASSVYFTGDCNVRTGPGLGYGKLGSVTAGSTLTWLGGSSVDSRGVTWYSVNFRGSTGWVSSVYGRLSNSTGYAYYGATTDAYSASDGASYSYSSGYASGTRVQAVSGDTYVRTGPSLNYSKLGVLYQGGSLAYTGSVRYDGRGVAWYSVNYNGYGGWVSSRYTSLY